MLGEFYENGKSDTLKSRYIDKRDEVQLPVGMGRL